MNENFKKWATGFSGFDGGNPNGEIWLCGIEWGGDSPNNINKLYELFEKDVSDLDKIIGYGDFKINMEHDYNKRFINIIGSLKNKDFPIDSKEVYKCIEELNEKEKFFTKDSNYMKLNLSPFNFPTTNKELWSDDYKQITGFKNKIDYEQWVWKERKKVFNDMTQKYKPKLIITFGASRKYFNNYLDFFCFQNKDINPSIKYKTSNRLSLKYAFQNNILLINLYFPSMGWLVTTESLKETGEIIRDLMQKYNVSVS